MLFHHRIRPIIVVIFGLCMLLSLYFYQHTKGKSYSPTHRKRFVRFPSALEFQYADDALKKQEDISAEEEQVDGKIEAMQMVDYPINNTKQHAGNVESSKLKQSTNIQQPLHEFMGRIVYNRVGKCGSRSMLNIISKLSKRNMFTFYSSKISNQTRPNLSSLKESMKIINELPPPWLYSRHIHYVNFHKFGMMQPVYINMIRDPVERFSSQYHFQRFGDKIKQGSRINKDTGSNELDINDCILTDHNDCTNRWMNYIVAYFCGQKHFCATPSRESLEEAKRNLLNNYLAVGYLEDFEGMLEVLEKLLPKFFSGATQMWNTIQNATKERTATVNKSQINSTAYAIIKQRLHYEYEFYDFAKVIFGNLKKDLNIV